MAAAAEMRLPSEHVAVRLKRRPVGLPKPGVDLVAATEAIPVKEWIGSVEKDDGSSMVIVRNLYLSLDPAMRGWMKDQRSYLPPVPINGIMRGGTVAEVVFAHETSGFKPGDVVSTFSGWCEYALCKAKSLTRIQDSGAGELGLPLSAHLGILGGTGLTAYFGLLDIGQPKSGDVVLVSGAAGATGSTVCQIAKNVIGCKVIGVCGGKAKTDWLKQEGIADETVDYKDAAGKAVSPEIFRQRLKGALQRVGSRGVDIYFDNVGGYILDEAMRKLNMKARIVVCGAISTYNSQVEGPKNYLNLIVSRARMEGFLLMDYATQYVKARRDLATWISEGKLKFKEDVRTGGLHEAPGALLSLFNGKNKGKLVVRVATKQSRL